MSRVHQNNFFENRELDWSMRHAVLMRSLNQQKNRGAGWSCVHVLGLLTHGLMVRVYVTGCVLQAKCFPKELPNGVGRVRQPLAAIDATSTGYLQSAVLSHCGWLNSESLVK